MNDHLLLFSAIISPFLFIAIFLITYLIFLFLYLIYSEFLIPFHSATCTCEACTLQQEQTIQNQNHILALFRSDFLNPQLVPDLIDDNGTY